MALEDINFQEGDIQDFIVEVPTGTLNAPQDILVEPSGSQFLLLEAPQITGGGGNIFIIND